MAENPTNPLNQALTGLGTTIQTITGKVEAGKERVRAYKSQLIAKLREVVDQLNKLKDDNNLKSIPQLRNQLQTTQESLQQRTEELAQTKGLLDAANRNLSELQTRMNQINQELENKNRQIADLTNSGREKDKAIEELGKQITDLDNEKKNAEHDLINAQEQINLLVQKIGQINVTLENQIQLIDSIVAELGDLGNEGDDVAVQFKNVGENIQTIMNMLKNPGQGPAIPPNPNGPPAFQPQPQPQVPRIPPKPMQRLFSQETNNYYNKFMASDNQAKSTFYRKIPGPSRNVIQRNIEKAANGDQEAITVIKTELSNIIDRGSAPLLGGKSRRNKRRNNKHKKTIKRKLRKTKKNYKGGYVYSSSKELDKASSLITSLSGTKSRSNKKYKQRLNK